MARPYRGPSDHPAIVEVLAAHRAANGDTELPTVAQVDVTCANLHDCDPDLDIALVEADGHVVAYARAHFEDLASGVRDCIVFAPTLPEHLGHELWAAVVDANEAHMEPWASDVARAQYRAHALHPGPSSPALGEAAWLEDRGYIATEWDFREQVEADWVEFIEQPYRDTSLWKVAWAGDTVVGQVKTYINTDDNDQRGVRRGYTEYISTHREWRNRGIAGTLLAWSLQELQDRGMTEAALWVDTNNPGGAFALYTALGFELVADEAVYTRPVV